MAHPEFNGWHVPAPVEALSGLMGALSEAVGCTTLSGAVMTDIGNYGLPDPRFAASNAIALNVSDRVEFHGVVCEAMPQARIPPTLHLFDADGRCLHRIHATSPEECRLVMGFTGKVDPSSAAPPFQVEADEDRKAGILVGMLTQQNLHDLLDFCQHLRLPLLKWVGSDTCRQSHYGAIDNLWWRSGCYRLKANNCTMSADLSFAAHLNVIEHGPDMLHLALADERGHSFAGFGHSENHDQRSRASWSNMLRGLCMAPHQSAQRRSGFV